jgi:hypothetical protein
VPEKIIRKSSQRPFAKTTGQTVATEPKCPAPARSLRSAQPVGSPRATPQAKRIIAVAIRQERQGSASMIVGSPRRAKTPRTSGSLGCGIVPFDEPVSPAVGLRLMLKNLAARAPQSLPHPVPSTGSQLSTLSRQRSHARRSSWRYYRWRKVGWRPGYGLITPVAAAQGGSSL